VLGPKAYEGDLQVPEGFYQIDGLNPRSQFHLSLHVNYPNQADRLRNPAEPRLGYAIMVHGNCVTIGCLPLEDGPISRLYAVMVAARDNGVRDLPIHIHPCRHDRAQCIAAKAKAAAGQPSLVDFWRGLEVGHGALRDEARLPKMAPTANGGYRRVR
jgi:murein L,D-transpeptidase YafK